MSGLDDLISESNRWAEAERRSQGVTDNGIGDAIKKYYTRYFPAGLVAIVTAGTVGAMMLDDSSLGGWPSYIVGGFLLASLGSLIGGALYNAKKVQPMVKPGRIGVLLSLNDEEQKQVRRQILGKEPVDARHVAVIRAAAVQTRKVLATQIMTLTPMLPLAFIPQALRFTSPLWLWSLMALAAVLALAAGMLVVWEFRQAGKLLTSTVGEPSDRT